MGVIEILGWLALMLGGAWAVMAISVSLLTGFARAGLDRLPAALFLGGVVAIVWCAFILSVATVGVSISGAQPAPAPEQTSLTLDD